MVRNKNRKTQKKKKTRSAIPDPHGAQNTGTATAQSLSVSRPMNKYIPQFCRTPGNTFFCRADKKKNRYAFDSFTAAAMGVWAVVGFSFGNLGGRGRAPG